MSGIFQQDGVKPHPAHIRKVKLQSCPVTKRKGVEILTLTTLYVCTPKDVLARRMGVACSLNATSLRGFFFFYNI